MWWFALMMFTSPAFPFILFVCIGLSEAAPRVIPHNALTLSVLRKPREISEATVEHRNITIVNRFPEEMLGIVSFTGLTPAPTVLPTSKTIHATAPSPTTIELPTTDPTTPSLKTTSTVGVQPAVFGQEIHGLVTLESNSATSVSSVRKTGQTMGSENSQGANNMSDIIATSDDSQELVCNCSSGGVLDPDECDRTTGQCVCLMGYTGLQCEECEEDHFPNGTARCLPCSCDSFGAVSPRCDSAGICVCKTGVYGPKCDDCHPGFFHFSATGCQPCQCNGHSTDCQPQSGICTDCQNNTQGQNCEECQVNFYRRHGDGVTDACLPCPCSPLTSTGSCHLDSGGNPACDQCKPGFSGASCDVCADGFRRSGGACVPCDCNGNADPNFAPQICHPETGRCHGCANHAAGAHCEICADGYTGDARAHNCTRRSVRVLFPEDPGTLIGATQESTTTTSAPSPSVTPLQTPTPSTTSAPAMSTTLLRLTSAPGGHGARTAPPDREDPMGNSTASALTVVSWTQFNIIILAVIIVMVVLLMGFVGGVYMYREYRNRKLNAPFWTIELKEDNISFSSYHDSIPHADPAGLLEEEPCVVAANGQLALATAANMYKA